MRLLWEDRAWDDYLCWQGRDRKILKRINALINDIKRTPFEGIGKPEPLKGNLNGYWSRRIDEANRLVYYEQDSIFFWYLARDIPGCCGIQPIRAAETAYAPVDN